MRLTVLGGSAAGGNTGQGCAGYLVDTGSTRIVLDLGPGTFQELRKHVDYRTLDAVVISHLHVDHILDVAAMRFALAYHPVSPTEPVSLWLPPGGPSHFDRLGNALAADPVEKPFFASQFTIFEYDPRVPLTIGDAELSFHPTVHYIPCWAIRIDAGGKSLVYTADTGPASDLSGLAAGADVVLSESTLLVPSNEQFDRRGHLTVAEAAGIARDAQASTLVLTHYWETTGQRRMMATASEIFPGRSEIARPGLSIEW